MACEYDSTDLSKVRPIVPEYDPTAEFKRQLAGRIAFDRYGFDLGRVYVGLEILNTIKTLESAAENLLMNREEITSALRTLLRRQDLEQTVEEWYERLSRGVSERIARTR